MPKYNVYNLRQPFLHELTDTIRRAKDSQGRYISGVERTEEGQTGVVIGDIGLWAQPEHSDEFGEAMQATSEHAATAREPRNLVTLVHPEHSFGAVLERFITLYNGQAVTERPKLFIVSLGTPHGVDYFFWREGFQYAAAFSMTWKSLNECNEQAEFFAGRIYQVVMDMLESSFTEGTSSKFYVPEGSSPQTGRILF